MYLIYPNLVQSEYPGILLEYSDVHTLPDLPLERLLHCRELVLLPSARSFQIAIDRRNVKPICSIARREAVKSSAIMSSLAARQIALLWKGTAL